jgi:K+-transporting ATPase KdpF subunit
VTARNEQSFSPQRLRDVQVRIKEMFDYIISGIVSVLLLVYLGWAMFQPEKF